MLVNNEGAGSFPGLGRHPRQVPGALPRSSISIVERNSFRLPAREDPLAFIGVFLFSQRSRRVFSTISAFSRTSVFDSSTASFAFGLSSAVGTVPAEESGLAGANEERLVCSAVRRARPFDPTCNRSWY